MLSSEAAPRTEMTTPRERAKISQGLLDSDIATASGPALTAPTSPSP